MTVIPPERKGGPSRTRIIHHIMSAAVTWDTTTLYKGSNNIGVAANSTEASGGLEPVEGLLPDKHYKITQMYGVLGAAPGGGITVTITLRVSGSDSTLGVLSIAGASATTDSAVCDDIVLYSDYVTVSVVSSATAASANMKIYLTVEEV